MAGAAVDKVYVRHCRDESIRLRRNLPHTVRYRRRKVRLYTQAKVVTHILANAPQKVTSVSNGDHSKMFERLPHTMIIVACMHKFKIAAETKKSQALLVASENWSHSVAF